VSCPCLRCDFGPQCRPGRGTENGPTQRGSEVSYCWMNNSCWIKTLSIKTPLSHTAAPSDSSRATPSDSCTLAPIPPSAFYGLSSFGRTGDGVVQQRPLLGGRRCERRPRPRRPAASSSSPLSLSLPLILSAATAWPTACSSSPLRLSMSLLLSGAAVGELARARRSPRSAMPGPRPRHGGTMQHSTTVPPCPTV